MFAPKLAEEDEQRDLYNSANCFGELNLVLSRARRGTLISDLPIGSDHVQRCSTISAYKGSTQKITTPGEHVLIVAVIKLLPSFANHKNCISDSNVHVHMY